MHRLIGTVQHYDWGTTDDIARLLGRDPDGRPWAEYWLGTHPGAPSRLTDGTPLTDAVGTLPFLLKLLAAGQPLSLQTHPDTRQAQEGFAREDAAGLAVDDPRRIYRDRSAKPELLCALTPFDALCGFREVDASARLLREVGADALADTLERRGLAETVAALYRGEIDAADTIEHCRRSARREAALVADLSDQYPGDPSIAVTLLMNRVLLQPGDAVFLAAGNLHAYLRGVGVEIMTSSDNVVRGGLTSKHVDVEELLRVVDPSPLADPVVRPVEVDQGSFRYPTAPVPFVLWRHEVRDGGSMHHCADGREVALCTRGSLGSMAQGDAVVLADGEAVEWTGHGTVFVAAER